MSMRLLPRTDAIPAPVDTIRPTLSPDPGPTGAGPGLPTISTHRNRSSGELASTPPSPASPPTRFLSPTPPRAPSEPLTKHSETLAAASPSSSPSQKAAPSPFCQRVCTTNRLKKSEKACACTRLCDPSATRDSDDESDAESAVLMAPGTSFRRGLSPGGVVGPDSRASTPVVGGAASVRFTADNGNHAHWTDDTAPVRADEGDAVPTLLHRVKHDRSILSLAVNDRYVYAGSQSGEVLIWSIDTFQLVSRQKGHTGSVLCLALAADQNLLLSSGGDAVVQIWHAETHRNLYTIYSTYDVGDVFCLAYSPRIQTMWLGAQNTSIQWYDLKDRDTERPRTTPHPLTRSHRFFDSTGPGGRATPVPLEEEEDVFAKISRVKQLEIAQGNIVQYAHYGYVYCMLVIPGAQIGRADDEILLSGGGDGAVKLWRINPETGSIRDHPAETLDGGDAGVLSMIIKDTVLYCGLTGGDICIWDLDTMQLVRTIKAHCDDVLTMTVMSDSIFSGSACGFARKWNHRFECISRWQAHTGIVLASAVTKRNDRLLYITGGNDDCVAVWDVSQFTEDAVMRQPGKSQNDFLLSSLAKFVSFRTVGSNPSCSEECRRGATYLKQLFKRSGAMASLLPTEDGMNPIVFARFAANPAKRSKGKTVLFYGHYDVIPAESGAGWRTDPFELVGENGYLYARGVSDNKGPILAAMFAAGELYQQGRLTSDIIFLVEGEEESGSRGFKEAVRRNKSIIGDVDWILLANSYWLDDETPCLTYGLRGVIHTTVSIESEKPDLHSGVDGSRFNREPTVELVSLLAKLTGEDGLVQIPGFYDPIRPIDPAEDAMYGPITATLRASRKHPLAGMDEAKIKAHLMAKWRDPSLTIHRVDVSGPTNTTIIPRSASAAISLRIVPDQDIDKVKIALVKFLRESYTGHNNLEISIDHEAEPWLGDPRNKAFRLLESAVMKAWSTDEDEEEEQAGGLGAAKTHREVKRPLYIREGGSIPGIRFLEKEFGAPAAHLPCGQASDGAHLDNERLRLVNLYKSKRILRDVFEGLGNDVPVE